MTNPSGDKDFRRASMAYLTGFASCLIVTLLSFSVVMFAAVGSGSKIALITILAACQVALQSYYFLHVGRSRTPKWKTAAYIFTIINVVIIVLGSLWIMANLNYNMKHDMQKAEQEIIKDEVMPGRGAPAR